MFIFGQSQGLSAASPLLLNGRIGDLLDCYPSLSALGFLDPSDPTAASDVRTVDPDRVRSALFYIEQFAIPTKRICSARSSRGLAREAGRYGAPWGFSDDVAAGDFIAAALLTGFSFRRDPGGPDCVFGMRIRGRARTKTRS